MARRMFSADIVASDAFLEMPTSSRELYFQLGMYADDDGFVNPKKIMRMIGASDDDLKVLLSKRFLLAFETGVVVIKHWLIHNMIRKDRYKETMYLDEKSLLQIKDNGAYTELATNGLPNGNQRVSQVRLGKVRLGKEETLRASSPVLTIKEKKQPQSIQWETYLDSMDNSKAEHITLIAHYFRERKIKFDTDFEVQEAISRHSRYATKVVKFGKEKVFNAIEECKRMEKQKGIQWTLETVYKQLTK